MMDFKPAGRSTYAVKMAEIRPDDVVLDIGCFDGGLERHLLRGKCKSYFGVDVNAEAVEFAKKFESEGRSFQVAFAETLPFTDATFDKVFILDVFEHVENEKKVLSEISRVLKPEGTLVLSVPHDFLNFLDPDDLTRGARNLWRSLRGRPLLTHSKHRHYSESLLREFFGNSFQVERVHKSGTMVFWFLAVFYNSIALPDRLTAPFRRFTNWIEDVEYSVALPTGFNIMVRAKKASR